MAIFSHIAYSLRQKLAISWALRRANAVYRPLKISRKAMRAAAFAVIIVAIPSLTTCVVVLPAQNSAAIEADSDQVVYRILEDQDPGLALYRQSSSKKSVIDFYTAHVGNRDIAEAITREASANDIPLTLAFSLAWAESRFYPRAVNHNFSSIDRGLFQLNNKSFPELSLEEYFDPDVSARVGLAYLRWCIDTGGNEVVALAMYNAGQGRVEGKGTPLMTLRHISDILEYRDLLETYFAQSVQFIKVASLDGTADSNS